VPSRWKAKKGEDGTGSHGSEQMVSLSSPRQCPLRITVLSVAPVLYTWWLAYGDCTVSLSRSVRGDLGSLLTRLESADHLL